MKNASASQSFVKKILFIPFIPFLLSFPILINKKQYIFLFISFDSHFLLFIFINEWNGDP
jgi:hypothetical protein